jgi:hypothetical protein
VKWKHFHRFSIYVYSRVSATEVRPTKEETDKCTLIVLINLASMLYIYYMIVVLFC